jgi:hypothetical protein
MTPRNPIAASFERFSEEGDEWRGESRHTALAVKIIEITVALG